MIGCVWESDAPHCHKYLNKLSLNHQREHRNRTTALRAISAAVTLVLMLITLLPISSIQRKVIIQEEGCGGPRAVGFK